MVSMTSESTKDGRYGEGRYNAKLTDAKVVEMRRRWFAGETLNELAAAYGVNRAVVHAAIRRKTWKHVSP